MFLLKRLIDGRLITYKSLEIVDGKFIEITLTRHQQKTQQRIVMADGKLPKPEEDFTALLDTELPLISQLPLPQALERLTVLEKQTRQASDAISTRRILVKVVELCANSNEWNVLNEQTLAFTKKHGQLKAAIQGMVVECWNLLKSVKWEEQGIIAQRGKLIETLRVVTEGKVLTIINFSLLMLDVCGS